MNEFLQIYLQKIQLACLNLKLLQEITLQTWVEEWAVKWKKGEAEPGSKMEERAETKVTIWWKSEDGRMS